jgi:transcriptional regulator with XRE-family HTH domain
MPSPVGELLRRWRTSRGKSQLELSVDAEVSTRHISFIENGRSAPSREMLLVLASALDIPLRERNTLLLTAGYAPAYRETSLASPELAHVRAAIDCILHQSEPNGALVVDRAWHVVQMNGAAQRILASFIADASILGELEGDLALALFEERGLRRSIVNFEEVAGAWITRLHREAAAQGADGPATKLVTRLLAYPGVPARWREPDPTEQAALLIPVHLRRGGLEARLFTTITTLGTPLDVTLDELRIESYYPADDATARWLRGEGAS